MNRRERWPPAASAGVDRFGGAAPSAVSNESSPSRIQVAVGISSPSSRRRRDHRVEPSGRSLRQQRNSSDPFSVTRTRRRLVSPSRAYTRVVSTALQSMVGVSVPLPPLRGFRRSHDCRRFGDICDLTSCERLRAQLSFTRENWGVPMELERVDRRGHHLCGVRIGWRVVPCFLQGMTWRSCG